MQLLDANICLSIKQNASKNFYDIAPLNYSNPNIVKTKHFMIYTIGLYLKWKKKKILRATTVPESNFNKEFQGW